MEGRTDLAIEVHNLAVTLGRKRVLEEITFAVRRGAMTGIIGPNGAGKTTLLRVILGLVPLCSGTINVLGFTTGHLKECRSLLGYMPQLRSYDKRFPLAVADVIATGLLTARTLLKRVKGQNEKIDAALDLVAMTGFKRHSFQNLSGGEQQRILLARALVRQPQLLLLDEPNAGLDFPAQQAFIELLIRLKTERGLTIVLVSHDLLSVASYADQLVCINRTMHIHGQPAEVLASSQLNAAYRCQFDFLKGDHAAGGCNHD